MVCTACLGPQAVLASTLTVTSGASSRTTASICSSRSVPTFTFRIG